VTTARDLCRAHAAELPYRPGRREATMAVTANTDGGDAAAMALSFPETDM